jgi:serine/threonine protein kinase
MNDSENPARRIFLEAIEKPDSQWTDFITLACGDDGELRARVEGLLQAHLQLGSFHDAQGPTPATVALGLVETAGAQVGRYKLLQKIGEGGMGVVFMAEQTAPVQRKVALKVIKPGMDSQQVIARFEAERQALAIMDHVNIARVLDAGTTEQGRPYFVMELVHGVPITKYCDDNHLTPRQRLELFLPVCQAIQHAHQKGIIHRDIKPSNVMVTLYDGKPVPKVIDFGVAKATEQKLTDRTLFTHYGMMVGTLEYMSPEQAEMSALGVDTRSDIYSLGVLLYELLTGSTPISGKRMRQAGHAEIVRMIKEEEPARPSTRVSESGDSLASISAQRRTDPSRLSKLMRGELDWIVMKTLEKDRNRRYDSASGLAADLQRYLNDEPVEASPPSSWYRMRKYVRRHRGALATATIVGAALIAATVVSSWQAYEAKMARRLADDRLGDVDEAKSRADASYQKARETVKKLLAEIATDDVVRIPGMRDLYLKLIDEAIYSYDELSKLNPQDAEIYADQGELYFVKGEWKASARAFDQAVHLAQANHRFHYGLARAIATGWPIRFEKGTLAGYSSNVWEPLDIESAGRALAHAKRSVDLSEGKIVAYRLLRARILFCLNHVSEAMADIQAAEAMTPLSLDDLIALAAIYNNMEDHDRALKCAQQALALAPHHPSALFHLANSHRLSADFPKAIDEFTESLQQNPLVNHRDKLDILAHRAAAYLGSRRYAEALADLDEVLDKDPTRVDSYKHRALANFHLKKFADTLGDLEKGYDLDPMDLSFFEMIPVDELVQSENQSLIEGFFRLARKNADTRHVLAKLHCARADVMAKRQDYEGAWREIEQASEFDPDSVIVANSSAAQLLLFRGDPYRSKVSPLFDRYSKYAGAALVRGQTELANLSAQFGPQSPVARATLDRLQEPRMDLMLRLNMNRRYGEAERLASRNLQDLREAWGPQHPKTYLGSYHMGLAFYTQGNYEKAEQYIQSAADGFRGLSENVNPAAFEILKALISVQLELGKLDEAEAAVAQLLERSTRVLKEDHPDNCLLLGRLAEVVREKGELERAEALQLKCWQKCLQMLGADDPSTDGMGEDLITIYELQGKYQEMEPIAREVLEHRERRLPKHWLIFHTQSLLGASLMGQQKVNEAEPLLISAYEGLRAHAPATRKFRKDLARTAGLLARICETQGKETEAAGWLQKATEHQRTTPPSSAPADKTP